MMEFEHMQKIWDQQSNQVVYGINENKLFESVIKRQQKIKKLVGCFEWTAIFTFVGLAGLAVIEGIIKAEYYQLPLGILFVGLAVYMLKDRQKRLNNDNLEVKNIKTSLENSISSLSHQINRQRNIVWWFFSPLCLVAVYQGVFGDKAWWAIGVAIVAMLAIYWLTQKEIRCKLAPKLKELEALKRLIEKQD